MPPKIIIVLVIVNDNVNISKRCEDVKNYQWFEGAGLAFFFEIE